MSLTTVNISLRHHHKQLEGLVPVARLTPMHLLCSRHLPRETVQPLPSYQIFDCLWGPRRITPVHIATFRKMRLDLQPSLSFRATT